MKYYLLIILFIAQNVFIADEIKLKQTPQHQATTPQVEQKRPEVQARKLFNDYVEITPVFKGTQQTDKCLYTYKAHCFESKEMLEKYLQLRTKNKCANPNTQKTTKEILTFDQAGKEQCKNCIQYDGKSFLSEEDYLLYLVELDNGIENKDCPAPIKEEPLKPYTFDYHFDFNGDIPACRNLFIKDLWLFDEKEKGLDFNKLTALFLQNRTMKPAKGTEIENLTTMLKRIEEANLTGTPFEIKKGYEKVIERMSGKPLTYDFYSDSIIDIANKSSLQCMSGTALHEIVCRKAMGEEKFRRSNPVILYENGHTAPGYFVKEGNDYRLFSAETTLAGTAKIDYGLAKDLKNTQVVDANDWLVAEILKGCVINPGQLAKDILDNTAKKYGVKQYESPEKRYFPTPESPYSIFGIGSPQKVHGQFTRPLVDAKSRQDLESNEYLKIDSRKLSPGEQYNKAAPPVQEHQPEPTSEILSRPNENKVLGTLLPGTENGFLILGQHRNLDRKGPGQAVGPAVTNYQALAGTDHPESMFERFQGVDKAEKVKVCLNPTMLGMLPQESRSLINQARGTPEASNLAGLLPRTRDTEVDKFSIKLVGQDICYELSRGLWYVEKDQLKAAEEHYAKAFKDIKGIHALPADVQTELKNIWAKEKTMETKVAAVENFWRTKVAYLLDDHALYADYFKKNPDRDMVSAACDIKQGRCVPKNYGLAVTLNQLSEGKLPVRVSYGVNLGGEEKEKGKGQELNAKHLHLGVEVLMPDPSGHGIWTGVEASVAALPETEDAKKQRAEIQNIRQIVEKELAGRKSLVVSLTMTKLGDITEHSSQLMVGLPELTKVEVNSVTPSTQTQKMTITEDAQGVNISPGNKIPGMKFIDLFAGDPKYLTLFMGEEPRRNKMEMARAWQSLGGRRYQDTRVLKIYLPGGKVSEIKQVFTLDFSKPAIVEHVDHYQENVKVYDVVGK